MAAVATSWIVPFEVGVLLVRPPCGDGRFVSEGPVLAWLLFVLVFEK